MKFEIVSEIEQVETIAVGKSIRVLSLLNKNTEKVDGGRKKVLQLLN